MLQPYDSALIVCMACALVRLFGWQCRQLQAPFLPIMITMTACIWTGSCTLEAAAGTATRRCVRAVWTLAGKLETCSSLAMCPNADVRTWPNGTRRYINRAPYSAVGGLTGVLSCQSLPHTLPLAFILRALHATEHIVLSITSAVQAWRMHSSRLIFNRQPTISSRFWLHLRSACPWWQILIACVSELNLKVELANCSMSTCECASHVASCWHFSVHVLDTCCSCVQSCTPC